MNRFLTFMTAVCVATLFAGVARAQQLGQDQSQSQSQGQSQGQSQAAGQEQGQQPPAQQDQGATKAQGPIPAYRSPLAGATDNDDEDNGTAPVPDTTPVTGAQNMGLGTTNPHNYWQPHLDIFVSADSNPAEAVGHSSWGSWVSLSGGVDVLKFSQNNEFELNYIGGGMFSNNNTDAGNGAVQNLEVLEKKTFHRWALTVADDLGYLPESSAGFGGLGVGLPGTGGVGGGALSPGQSLIVGRGQSLSNMFDTEADVFVTGRTSLTFVGAYSSLNYFDSDLLNYGTVNARAGYNYQLNRKDTLGLLYDFSETNFSNFHQELVAHSFQVAYGHRVTGRLAFQISAGPQVATFTLPITPGTGGTTASGPSTSVYWSLNSNVEYAMKRNYFGLSYAHSVAGGSGVLAGAEADTASGSVTRQMNRAFSSGITGGYSREKGLAVVNVTPTGSQTFDYWYGGGNLSHPLGRTAAVTLSYELQYQTSGNAFCVGTGTGNCATNYWRNLISVGFNWRDREHRF